MPIFLESRTFSHLLEMFVAHAASVQRYRYMSQSAEIEGRDSVASAFRKLAELDTVDAAGHLDLVRRADVSDPRVPARTAQNLSNAIDTELQLGSQSYPRLARIALEEGYPDIADWFTNVAKSKRWRSEFLAHTRPTAESSDEEGRGV